MRTFLPLGLLALVFANTAEAKNWYIEPDFTKVPPEQATVVMTIAIDQYPGIQAGAFNPATKTYTDPLNLNAQASKDAVLESLSYVTVDGVQTFNNGEAILPEIEAFVTGLPHLRTLVVYVESLGWGSSAGDPMIVLTDTTVTDEVKGWRVADLKRLLAPKADNVFIILNTSRPGRIVLPDGTTTTIDGPSVKDFAMYGPTATNIFVVTPTTANTNGASTPLTCATSFGSGVLGPTLVELAKSGKDIGWDDLLAVTRTKAQTVSGCNLNIEAVLNDSRTVVFEGSGVTSVEQSVVTNSPAQPPIETLLPTKPLKRPKSALVRGLPWYATGGAALVGGLASGAVYYDRVDMINDESRARATFDSNEDRLTYAEEDAQFQLWSGLALTGIGLGAAGIGYGTYQVLVTPKEDSTDVMTTVTVPF